MGYSDDFEVGEIINLAKAMSTMMTACIGARQNGIPLRLDDDDYDLLADAVCFLEDAVGAIRMLNGNLTELETSKIKMIQCILQMVSDGRGKQWQITNIEEVLTRFQDVYDTIRKLDDNESASICREKFIAAQEVFMLIKDCLSDDEDEDNKVLLNLEPSVHNELRKAAQQMGTSVHRLVADAVRNFVQNQAGIGEVRRRNPATV